MQNPLQKIVVIFLLFSSCTAAKINKGFKDTKKTSFDITSEISKIQDSLSDKSKSQEQSYNEFWEPVDPSLPMWHRTTENGTESKNARRTKTAKKKSIDTDITKTKDTDINKDTNAGGTEESSEKWYSKFKIGGSWYNSLFIMVGIVIFLLFGKQRYTIKKLKNQLLDTE